MRLDLDQRLARVLPRRADRIVAKALTVLALGPILLLASLWVVDDTTAAQLTWSLRAPPWPFAIQRPPFESDASWCPATGEEFPLDPWGEPYQVEEPADDDTRVCSAGPNRVFEAGGGDDVQVAGFFFFGRGRLLILLAVLGVLASGAGAYGWVALRQALLPRSPRLGVELARAAVVSLPIVAGCLCLVFATDLDDLARRSSSAHVSPLAAIVFTTAFVVYIGVLYLRIGRARADTPE